MRVRVRRSETEVQTQTGNSGFSPSHYLRYSALINTDGQFQKVDEQCPLARFYHLLRYAMTGLSLTSCLYNSSKSGEVKSRGDESAPTCTQEYHFARRIKKINRSSQKRSFVPKGQALACMYPSSREAL